MLKELEGFNRLRRYLEVNDACDPDAETFLGEVDVIDLSTYTCKPAKSRHLVTDAWWVSH